MTAAAPLTATAPTRQQPACWDVDPELFFGVADSAEGQPVFAWEQRAVAICAGCPVRVKCLAAALEFPVDEQHGVVGGMTAGQRRALLRTSRQQPARSSVTDTPRDQRRLVQAAVRLHQAGQNGRQIATRLQAGERQVQRWLAAYRTEVLA